MSFAQKLAISLVSCSVMALAACAQTADTQEKPARGEATEFTRKANEAVAARLPIGDEGDVRDSERGFIAAIEGPAIYNDDGSVVWDIEARQFLNGDAPATVNPSLWRQSKLTAKHGLFEVVPGVYQVRGYDLSVMSIIEGETGWIIVDPLTSVETAKAALKLVNDTLGERPVSAMLYTHSHVDHFGGARGILPDGNEGENAIPIIAPIGFTESSVTENLIAGPAMSRRAVLMFGKSLPLSATGNVGAGLGPGLPQGRASLIVPTEEIGPDPVSKTIDGVQFEFIDAGGTEAPAEFMFYLPEKRALCTAEVATANFHNVLTMRGAKVRDALKWSKVIDEALVRFGENSDVIFASHHWPTWGNENVTKYLKGQRDIYRYAHDQTLRRANSGATMVEAAEALEEPGFSTDSFDTRGYYGSLNHNSKAIFQHYYGWWSGNPSKFYNLPGAVTAERYVAAMGGEDAVLKLGQAAYEEGDYRWAMEILNHLVFANPENQAGREWLAASYEQLGFQAESGAWRSYFLTAAEELRVNKEQPNPISLGSLEFIRAVPTLQLFDSIAARFDPSKLTVEPFSLNFVFPDRDEQVVVHVGPSVIVTRNGASEAAKATLTLDRTDFDRLLLRMIEFGPSLADGTIKLEGEAVFVGLFFGTLEQANGTFKIVEP